MTHHYTEPGPPEATRRRARGTIPTQVDVAIIGCGLGGLTAGAYLARSGLRVACFDGHYVAGGSATVFGRGKKDARYNFDVGLHYVGDCGPDGGITRILAGVGVDLEFLPMDQDGFDTLVLPDFEFRIPADVDLYRQRLVERFPGEVRGIDRYLKLLRGVREVGAMLAANRERMSPRILWRVLTRHPILARWQNATIGQFLDTCTKDMQLRAVLLGQNGDYGLPPAKVSALLHVGLANHYFLGAYYPRGGGQVIADSLAGVIEANGGSIHLRQRIASVIVEDGEAVGVVTETRRNAESVTVRAGAVLSNADITKTLTQLVGPEHLPSRWIKRVKNFEMPAALFITCLGVTADMQRMGASNYWIFDDYDFDRLYADVLGAETPTPRAAYITSATLKDPDNPHHAPAGVTNIEVMSMLSGDPRVWAAAQGDAKGWGYKRNAEYQARKLAVEDAMIGYLERRFPGTADTVVFRESATPMTHSRYTGATGGTSYGLACTPAQFGGKRPGYDPVIPGLWLCGASTRSGHGIVGAMSSGRASAAAIRRALAGRRVVVPDDAGTLMSGSAGA